MDNMNHAEVRQARESLGLAPDEAAVVLEVSRKDIYRMERAPEKTTSRQVPRRVARLYRAYLAGYRPADWPGRLTDAPKSNAESKEAN